MSFSVSKTHVHLNNATGVISNNGRQRLESLLRCFNIFEVPTWGQVSLSLHQKRQNLATFFLGLTKNNLCRLFGKSCILHILVDRLKTELQENYTIGPQKSPFLWRQDSSPFLFSCNREIDEIKVSTCSRFLLNLQIWPTRKATCSPTWKKSWRNGNLIQTRMLTPTRMFFCSIGPIESFGTGKLDEVYKSWLRMDFYVQFST